VVDQFVALAIPIESLEQANASIQDSRRDPNVAIQDPHNIPLGLPISFAEVPYLWVRSNVFLAYQYPCIRLWMGSNDSADGWNGWIMRRSDGKNQLVLRLGIL